MAKILPRCLAWVNPNPSRQGIPFAHANCAQEILLPLIPSICSTPSPSRPAEPVHSCDSHNVHPTGGPNLIRLSSVPRLLADPVTGRKPSPKSVHRWVTKGVRGVRLEAVKMPFGLCTTVEHLNEFVAALNTTERSRVVRQPNPTRRIREIERARALAQHIVGNGTGGGR